jgi:hypothetical protein
MPRAKLDKKQVRKPQGRTKTGSLANKLVEVFQGRETLLLGEAIEAVLVSGYKTSSKNLSTVGNILARDKRFRRVRSGAYALKG